MFVQPHIVIAWQKQRFRRYWRRLSQRSQPGRPALAQEVRDLIRDMSRSNPTWRAPQIVEELSTLATVEKYRVRLRKPPSPTSKTFLGEG